MNQRLSLFERIADDILAAYGGEVAALERLIAHFGVSYNVEQLRTRVQSSVDDSRGAKGDPTLDDVRVMLARQYGFASWSDLAKSLAQPPSATATSRLGLSSSPPFYSIDATQRRMRVRPPLTDADWDVVFDVMREQQLTQIETAALTDSAMVRLAQLEFVTSVNLDGSVGFTDDALLHLARMPQLEQLDVSGWHSPLTDRGLAVLQSLPSLRQFKMCWPQRVTDAGIAGLAQCTLLEVVNLLGTPTGNGAVAAMRHKEHLREFIVGKAMTDDGIPLLHDIPAFKTWRGGEVRYHLTGFEGEPNTLMLDGPFTNAGLAALRGLDGLFSLGFFWHATAFDSNGLASLSHLPHLTFLGCEGERCDDAAMRRIAAIPRLRRLNAQGTVATDDGFAALSRSQTIEHIWGRECPNLTGKGFVALSRMPALRGLGVSCLNVDDHALASLPDFPALTFIMPMDVKDQGFRHVGRCAKLDALWCMYCRDTGDEATRHIASLGLRLYYAGKTKITDESLGILSRMDTLEKLEFWQTAGITDAGVATLSRLPRLKEFEVSGAPHVTREGASVFRPEVRVIYGG